MWNWKMRRLWLSLGHISLLIEFEHVFMRPMRAHHRIPYPKSAHRQCCTGAQSRTITNKWSLPSICWIGVPECVGRRRTTKLCMRNKFVDKMAQQNRRSTHNSCDLHTWCVLYGVWCVPVYGIGGNRRRYTPRMLLKRRTVVRSPARARSQNTSPGSGVCLKIIIYK